MQAAATEGTAAFAFKTDNNDLWSVISIKCQPTMYL